MFNKSDDIFPVKKKTIFLAHCSISPVFAEAAEAIQQFVRDMAESGIVGLPRYFDALPRLHANFARFLRTDPANVSYVHNVAEALSMLANGYRFAAGDEVISYKHEYPSNHYPWLIQQKRGVRLKLLSDNAVVDDLENISRPRGWSLEELEATISDKTRIVAISHVQFTSGFAADLEKLGALCKKNNIDLVVDCAQSLGCLPVYPEEYNIAAVVSSGWKWLLGPMGSGLLYTSPSFREKISETMVGPGLMHQGLDYLDLGWNPHQDGRKFEVSTLPWDHVMGLNVLFEKIFLRYSMEEIRDEIFRLQDIFLERLDSLNLRFLRFPRENRSGILAAEPFGDSKEIVTALARKNIIITAPVGYLRFAPHFYNDDSQLEAAAAQVGELFLSR